MAKRGRPLKPDAKRGGIYFRLDENESNMLKELSEKTGKNRTEIFTNLLGREYKRVMKRKG